MDESPTSKQKARRAATQTAKAVGMGRQKLERAEEVVEAAESDPEQFGDLPQEMDRTGRVNGVYRKLKVRQQAAEIGRFPPAPIAPVVLEGRAVRVFRHAEDKRWAIEIAPNEAGMKVQERVEELEREDRYRGRQEEIDSVKAEAVELRRQADQLVKKADKVDKKADKVSGERRRDMCEHLRNLHGPAYTHSETIDYEPLPEDVDEKLKVMPPDEVIKLLLHSDDPNIRVLPPHVGSPTPVAEAVRMDKSAGWWSGPTEPRHAGAATT